MTQEVPSHDDNETPGQPSRWQENHGNFLMGFVGIVVLLGGAFLIYNQNRFVPPRFPRGEMIDTLPGAMADEGISVASGEAVIRVSGAVNDYGMIKIAVYGSDATFNQPPEAILSETIEIIDGESIMIVTVSELPEKIAVAAFHDENGDEALNRNRFGIPAERYGFSRNARGLTGPPSFNQTVIPRPKAGETIEIFIR
ncbi:MAG: DUF2141 domain-containing protein [Rubripirellula sp.]